MATGAPIIEFKGISKVFDKGAKPTLATEGIDLSVIDGEFLAVVGPSGCGKSTLLNMAAGLMVPTRGTVTFLGAPLQGVNTDVGYITQKDNLLPWRTVVGNVRVALEVRGTPKHERERLVADQLQLVGLQGFEGHYPAELSGGMRKRVTLARTLVYDPHVLLMDEPFGALDAQLRLILQRQLLDIWSASSKTVVFVTHDLYEAISLADRVVIMSTRPGRIRTIETVDLPRPRDMHEIRFDPRFQELYTKLWDELRDDVGNGIES